MFVKSTIAAIMAFSTALTTASVAPLPDRGLELCHDQGCNNCPAEASANNGYPECYLYPTDNIADFTSPSGNGYDVWWNSGDPGAGCKIIVRSPAGFDIPSCGYLQRSWDQAGCYYTPLQPPSFMLQFCCGVGDCDAAAPTKRSIEEVRAAHLVGETSSTSIVIDGLLGEVEGILDLGKIGEISWRRRTLIANSTEDDALASQEVQASVEAPSERTRPVAVDGADASIVTKRCEDSFDLRERYNKGGVQIRASPTQSCDAESCVLTISGSTTTTYSLTFTVGVNIGVFESSLSTTFEKSMSRSFSTSFTQHQGTTGYVSFIPAFDCYKGTYNNCEQGSQDGEICNPRVLPSGEQDGTFLFVYT